MPGSYTILLVDDDLEDIEMFNEIALELYPGTNCIVAENGLVAIEKLRLGLDNLPNLILLDLNMPILGGEQFLEKIAIDPRLSGIPIIVWSTQTYLTENLVKKYHVTVLQKPVSYNDLVNTVHLILGANDVNDSLAA
ncbi:MAG: response regulator [Bacteroidota bacterium]